MNQIYKEFCVQSQITMCTIPISFMSLSRIMNRINFLLRLTHRFIHEINGCNKIEHIHWLYRHLYSQLWCGVAHSITKKAPGKCHIHCNGSQKKFHLLGFQVVFIKQMIRNCFFSWTFVFLFHFLPSTHKLLLSSPIITDYDFYCINYPSNIINRMIDRWMDKWSWLKHDFTKHDYWQCVQSVHLPFWK